MKKNNRLDSGLKKPEMKKNSGPLAKAKKSFFNARKATAAAALGILGTIATADNTANADEGKNHDSKQFIFKAGFALTPEHYEPAYGLNARFTWIPGGQSHHKPHFELTLIDVGLSFYKIPVQAPELVNPKKDIQGTEFHIGSLATLAIPMGRVVELGLSGGFGVGFMSHHGSQIGQDKNHNFYKVEASTQIFPLAIVETELNFHIHDQFLVYCAYAPHFTLIKVSNEIPADEKKMKIDHTIIAGIGVDF